jgi:peptidyl-prolyl cis-trans isomerase SurA
MPVRGALRRGVVLAQVMALAGAPAPAEVVNRVVATVDGEPITARALERYAAERAPAGTGATTLLDALITDTLLEKEIKALGIVAREDEIDRYIEEVRARNGMGEERFREALAAQGIAWDTYRAKVKLEIEKAQLVNREIRQRVNVSPEEVRRHYEAHREDHAIAERVKVQDILFLVGADAGPEEVARVRAKAEEVRALALAGRPFADLAREFSEGPGADSGGVIGTFGPGEMEPEIEAAVFPLERGGVSEPVRSGTGFHLLRVDERIASGYRPLAEVEEEIRATLYERALGERFGTWLSRDLRERHHVEILD